MDKLVTQKEVLKTVSLSRQRVHELRKRGLFPKPVKIHGFSGLRFRNSGIQAFVDGDWVPPAQSSSKLND